MKSVLRIFAASGALFLLFQSAVALPVAQDSDGAVAPEVQTDPATDDAGSDANAIALSRFIPECRAGEHTAEYEDICLASNTGARCTPQGKFEINKDFEAICKAHCACY